MPPFALSTPVYVCWVCGGPFTVDHWNLGDLIVSCFPSADSSPDTLPTAPLCLIRCLGCGLVQLSDTVDRSLLFAGNYFYASGINGMMRAELRNIVRDTRTHLPQLRDGDWVLDIGANDGTLLRAWRDHLWESRPYRVAVEPSPTFRTLLRDAAEMVLLESFPTPTLHGYQFQAITSIAMLLFGRGSTGVCSGGQGDTRA